MFSKAYKIAKEFTRPVIVSNRFFNGKVESGLGAFIIINDSGWILTAAHIIKSLLIFQNHKKEIQVYEKTKANIMADSKLTIQQKNKKVKKLKINPMWVTNHSFWWSQDNLSISNFTIFEEADMAVGQLTPFPKNTKIVYPKFIDPSKMQFGTSLCKLGYPFHNIDSVYDSNSNSFTINKNSFPIPCFPMDGIYTRNLDIVNKKQTVRFLETSTPGLKGQSGGPIFDIEGNIWAMQSHTRHFPLGFSPIIKRNGKNIEENQFLNVGIGSHVETIIKFFNDLKIQFQKG